MSDKQGKRQLVVIGAGPGGYAAAFHASGLGMQVTLIDPEKNPGGVCLYRGCIPTKALLHVAKVITEAEDAKDFGVEYSKPTIDVDRIRSWKNSVVERLTQGLGQLTKKRKIEYIQGRATFVGSNSIEVKGTNGSTEIISYEHAILATGAYPTQLPGVPYDLPAVMDSTTALDLPSIPESMLIIGGGYIGLELGNMYAALGTRVSVVEMTSGLMPGTDSELVRYLSRRLEKLFESIMLKTTVAQITQHNNGVKVSFEGEKVATKENVYEKVLVAVGRRPCSEDLGLENTGIQVDKRGFVKIDEKRQTDDPAIYAIGDVAGGPLLAHKAAHEAMVAARAISGHKVAFEPQAIPFVEYTEPEVAECGLSETRAREKNIKIQVAKFPWAASGRAMTLNKPEGLTKLIIDPDTGRVLGAGIVGTGAGELISECALAVEMGALASDISLTIHPHPSLSETIMEAADVFLGHSAHVYRPKKD